MKRVLFRICAVFLAIATLISVAPMSAFALTAQEQEDFYRVNTWWQDEYNQQYIDWLLESDNFMYHLDISTGNIIHDMSYGSLNIDPKQRKDNFVEILTSFIGLSYDEIREQSAAEVYSDLSVDFLDGLKDYLEDTQLYTVDEFKYIAEAINETSDYYLSCYYGIDTDMGEYGYQAIYERIQSAFDNNVQDFDWPDHRAETLQEFYNFVDSSEWHNKLSKASDVFDAVGDSVELAKGGIALIGELESYNKTDEKLVELLKYIRAKTTDSALRAACDEIIGKFGNSYTQNIVNGILEIAVDTSIEWAYDEVKDLIVDKCGIYGVWAKIGIVAGNAVSDLWFNTTETKQQMQTIYCLDHISELLAPMLKTELQDLYSYNGASSFSASYAADAIYHMSVLIELRKKGEESYYKLKDSVYGASIIEACKTLGWGSFVDDEQIIEAWYSEFTYVIDAVKGSLYKMIPAYHYYKQPEPVEFEKEGSRLISYNGDSANVYIPTDVYCDTIDSYAFNGNEIIESVNIPYTIKTINANAFYNCTNLKSVTINSTEAVIADGVFVNCHEAFTIYGYNNSTAQAYASANGINFVSLDNEYENAQDYVDSDFVIEDGVLVTYRGKGGDVYIPYSVISIGEEAFYNCDDLTNIIIPNNVTSIGDSAFYGCSSLDNIIIPNRVIRIGSCAFEECTSLTSITIPDSVTSIGDYAFYGCTSLTNVTIGNSVTSIDFAVFCGCTGLTSVTIPDSVTSIGYHAFERCTGLTSVTIPDSVTSIGGYAFFGCTSLNRLTIPDSVTAIGDRAFAVCTSLTSITIPDSVTSIGEYAFYCCTSLNRLTIPDSVTNISYRAFYDCSGLNSVFIGKGVASIGDRAFEDCRSLKDVYITDPSAWCRISFGAYQANPMFYAESLHILDAEGNEVTEVILDGSVTTIPYNAFKNCTNLTSIIIPNSVIRIGSCAFEECTGLTSITIPDSVISIGRDAFYYCTSLNSLAISDGVTSIGMRAFYGCTCLETVFYKGTEEQWNAIEISSSNNPLTNATIVYNYGHEHVYETVVTEPTCTAGGYTTYTCSVCDYSYTANETEATGHIFNQQVKNIKYRKSTATINSPAIFYKTCACGESSKGYANEATFEYGERASGAVAKVGNTYYATVEEAIAAAIENGGEVKLLKNLNTANALVITGDVTIDFNGFTYTVKEPITGTQGYPVAVVIDNGANVTLKNGRLQIRYTSRSKFNYLIENNGTLTTQDIVLRGGNVYAPGATATILNTGAVDLKAGTVVEIRVNALSTMNANVTKDTSIEMKPAKGYHWSDDQTTLVSHVFDQETVLSQYRKSAATVNASAIFYKSCACGESSKGYANEVTFAYGQPTGSFVAKIGNTYFATIAEAIAAAGEGDVIEVTKKINDGEKIVITKNVTIDFYGFTYTVTATGEEIGAAITVADGVEATLTNGTVQIRYSARKNFNALIENSGNLHVENIVLKANNVGAYDAVLVKGNALTEGEGVTKVDPAN